MEPPFNHLDSTSLESTFPRIFAHNCHFSLFAVRATRAMRADTMIEICSPTCTPQRHPSPNHLPLIHRQGKLHAVLSLLSRQQRMKNKVSAWRNYFAKHKQNIPCTKTRNGTARRGAV